MLSLSICLRKQKTIAEISLPSCLSSAQRLLHASLVDNLSGQGNCLKFGPLLFPSPRTFPTNRNGSFQCQENMAPNIRTFARLVPHLTGLPRNTLMPHHLCPVSSTVNLSQTILFKLITCLPAFKVNSHPQASLQFLFQSCCYY